MKPVCLIIGAGAGIGGNVGRKFAQEGFHAVLCRRSDEAGLNLPWLKKSTQAAAARLGFC